MLIRIQPDGPVPIYEQISAQIIYGIAAGGLEAGNLIPSVRELAEQLLVHPNTANPRRDHLVNPLWIGPPVAVHEEKLPEEAAPEQPPAPNTHPVRQP